ncbi:AraC family transcriptional regulator [Legionella longbeachae]|uniref:GyrI-like domain-containing protein n=1 Tax=Legionella longbeachae TaxID=450 RepID=UPI0009B7B43B|nr:GyrI-like domain-containing protein [Legionella longbeachae]ARB92992.1 AraC family transcriptional regulator [Legionella longbeachae]RZV26644.1 AraC family transcriptional regulator [Legionella longbeachae]UAK47115.1 GyrI-like domain-containing protein [Legionella longbeachae]VEE04174.1 Transcription activator, effector binding [Legionella oakridgensis]
MTAIIPQLTQIQALTVTGISVRTKNEEEFNPQKAQLPHLWEQFYASKAQGIKQNTPVYGVYHRYESDSSGYYTVTAGIEIPNESKATHWDRVIIKAGDYLVFEAAGTTPSAIIKAWKTIWNYFNETSKYQRSYLTDFELYRTPLESAVYIGIK